MKIDGLIQLLNNRLREFKLSKDYAKMSGDLERMNAADKEVIALEDTLYKLNLLVDTSKSAAVKEKVLAEVITDGSVAVLGEYDITRYATDPLHEKKIMNILSKMGVMDTVEKIDDYIKGKYWSSPVTGEMIMSAALAYDVDVRLMMAIMEQDSSFGTAGKAVRTLNPGNVGNDDSGNLRYYESWQEGVTAVAGWLSRHRGSTIIPEIPKETAFEPVATSTPLITTPTATSITTSTTTTVTNIPVTPNQDSSDSSGTGQDATSTPLELNETSSTSNGAGTSTTTPVTATPTPTPEPEPTPEPTPEPVVESDDSTTAPSDDGATPAESSQSSDTTSSDQTGSNDPAAPSGEPTLEESTLEPTPTPTTDTSS